MIINVFELQSAKEKCPHLLRSLFELCHIDSDIASVDDNKVGHSISLEIDRYIASIVNAEDTLEAFIFMLSQIGFDINELRKLSPNTLLKETLKHKEKIIKLFD